jgi:hypothetical protein
VHNVGKEGPFDVEESRYRIEPGDFVMMRKELLGIKQRVEQASQAVPDHLGETVSREDFVQDSDGSELTLSEPG